MGDFGGIDVVFGVEDDVCMFGEFELEVFGVM